MANHEHLSLLFRDNFDFVWNIWRLCQYERPDLSYVSLVDADIRSADLTGCRIYGISAWGLKLSETSQRNLIITREGDVSEITIDNIEVAQFIYLLLHNEKIRSVIETITSKVVLILGRFTDERKAVLDALRDELRKRDYLAFGQDVDERLAIQAQRHCSPQIGVVEGWLARVDD